MSTVPFSRRRALPTDIERELPWHKEAERAVLGSILIDNSALATAREHLEPGDFRLKEHQRIFLAMIMLAEEQKPIDIPILCDRLAFDGAMLGNMTPLIASLADEMPRVSNVAYHAQIVREKARLRAIIETAYQVGQDARDPLVKSEDLITNLDTFTKRIVSGPSKKKLVATDLVEVISMDVSPIDHVLYPILPVKGIGMLYASRGVGKTYVSLAISYAIAVGLPKIFLWDIPMRRRVVYVDGEMDVETLQERLREIAVGNKASGIPEKNYFRLITPDLQKNFMPKINTKEGQLAIEEHLQPGDVLWADNLASLCPVSQEDETGDWIMVQEWLLSLRRGGITTMFDHHAGKSGTQRGSSIKEDVLNVVINLRRPDGYHMDEQLRAEVHLEKVRGKAAVGNSVQPFEITLRTDNGEAEWLLRPLKELVEKRAFEMLANGMKPNDIAQDLRLNRFQVYRLKKKFESGYKADELGEN
jgi:DnaB-like helicase N terminal domain/AAA domain